MKARAIGYILLVISLVMIVSGGVTSFLLGLRADKELTYQRMEDVSLTFEDFSTTISLFEERRDQLYTSTLSNVSYDFMLSNDSTIKTSLSNYEAMVDEIGKQVISLDGLCDDVYYPDGAVNNKCSITFIKNFKTYIYNLNVDKFNQYQAGIGSTVTISKYESTKDYIDYNNDKQFDGKEE